MRTTFKVYTELFFHFPFQSHNEDRRTTMEELLTSEAITIWFNRMFSTCRKCGALLSTENCYQRDDTRSHLHTYCKPCYIELQKSRNSQVVKSPKQCFYLINKTRPIFFDSKEEKEKYLADRKSLAKFSSQKEGYSSRVGCTESWNTDNKLNMRPMWWLTDL